MTTALVLFAHGARDPAWADPLKRVQAAVRQQAPGLPVELAFLEFIEPKLTDCIAGLVGAGARKIVILPMFIAQGGHLKRDLPEIVAGLRSTYPEVGFSLCGAIGEHESVIQAMAVAALSEAGLAFA